MRLVGVKRSSDPICRGSHNTAGSSIILWWVAVLHQPVVSKCSSNQSQHSHNHWTVVRDILSTNDMDAGEESPDTPMCKLSNDSMKDVDVFHGGEKKEADGCCRQLTRLQSRRSRTTRIAQIGKDQTATNSPLPLVLIFAK
jgi:hypothetical protein